MALWLNSLIRTVLVLVLALSLANGTVVISAMGHADGNLAEAACQTAYSVSFDQIGAKGSGAVTKTEVGTKASKSQSTPKKTSDLRCCIAQCNSPVALTTAFLPVLISTFSEQFASSSVELRPTGNDPLRRPPRSLRELA